MNRINSLSYLRAIACIAVIILHAFHSSSGYAFASGTISSSEMTAAVTIRNLMMWAVPCFVMVSGKLLLDPERKLTYKKIFAKYVFRMVIALLVFSVLFEVYDTLFAGNSLSFSVLKDGLKNVLTNGSWSHMWYLYLMIAVYIMLPFFRMVSEKLGKNDSLYLLTVYFVFLSAIPLIENISGTDVAFYICTYTVYPLYLFGGYIISKGYITRRSGLWISVFAVSTVLIAVLSAIAQNQHIEKLDSQLKLYSFPLIVLQSFGLFGLISNCNGNLPKVLHKILMEIDSCSFGMYLIHLAILKSVIAWAGFDPYSHGGTVTVFLLAILTAAASYIIIKLLKMLPGVKKIL